MASFLSPFKPIWLTAVSHVADPLTLSEFRHRQESHSLLQDTDRLGLGCGHQGVNPVSVGWEGYPSVQSLDVYVGFHVVLWARLVLFSRELISHSGSCGTPLALSFLIPCGNQMNKTRWAGLPQRGRGGAVEVLVCFNMRHAYSCSSLWEIKWR